MNFFRAIGIFFDFFVPDVTNAVGLIAKTAHNRLFDYNYLNIRL